LPCSGTISDFFARALCCDYGCCVWDHRSGFRRGANRTSCLDTFMINRVYLGCASLISEVLFQNRSPFHFFNAMCLLRRRYEHNLRAVDKTLGSLACRASPGGAARPRNRHSFYPPGRDTRAGTFSPSPGSAAAASNRATADASSSASSTAAADAASVAPDAATAVSTAPARAAAGGSGGGGGCGGGRGGRGGRGGGNASASGRSGSAAGVQWGGAPAAAPEAAPTPPRM